MEGVGVDLGEEDHQAEVCWCHAVVSTLFVMHIRTSKSTCHYETIYLNFLTKRLWLHKLSKQYGNISIPFVTALPANHRGCWLVLGSILQRI